jgi:hypothetical protein
MANKRHFARLKKGVEEGGALHVMLALRRSSHEVIVANKQLDGTAMMSELLGK